MTAGVAAETMNLLVRFTMSKETARAVKAQFTDMAARGEDVSYLDCVLFDAALDALGMEQKYYGIPDDEWQETLKQRKAAAARYSGVKTIDVTGTWREVLDGTARPGHGA